MVYAATDVDAWMPLDLRRTGCRITRYWYQPRAYRTPTNAAFGFRVNEAMFGARIVVQASLVLTKVAGMDGEVIEAEAWRIDSLAPLK